MDDQTVSLNFIYQYTMTEYVQFPETLTTGVAKFGGILAALRGLMIVMYMINRRQFERKVTKFLHKEKVQAEALQDSSGAPDEDHHAKNINKRKTVNIQDEEMINISDSLLNNSTNLSP